MGAMHVGGLLLLRCTLTKSAQAGPSSRHWIASHPLMSLLPFANHSARSDETGHIRRLRRSDRADFAAHLLRLDADSRRMRFGSAVNDGFLRRYAETALAPDSIAKGFFVGRTLRGAAELRGLHAALPEAAFSLERPWQGRGHGTRLFSSLVDAARNV